MKLFNAMLVMLCLITLCLWGFQPRYRVVWWWLDGRMALITGPYYGEWQSSPEAVRFHSCSFGHAYYFEYLEQRTLFGSRPVAMTPELLEQKRQTWVREKAGETTDTPEDVSAT